MDIDTPAARAADRHLMRTSAPCSCFRLLVLTTCCNRNVFATGLGTLIELKQRTHKGNEDMKRILISLALLGAALSTPALATNVGVSVNIGQPGFYGRIDVGGYPPPVLLYPQPTFIQRVPVDRPPIYLRVPPGHAKHWGKHCHRYNACGERVYFVQDKWYTHEYAPRYRERRGDRYDGDRDHRSRHDRYDDRRDDRRDHRDHDRGREHGRGREG